MTFLRAIPALAFALAAAPLLADPLPSWNDTPARAAIVAFVDSVTDPAADTYVPPADRIAVFDNDGTLWAEQPVYFQFFFALDRLKAMAAADPSILTSDTLKAAAAGRPRAAHGGRGEGARRACHAHALRPFRRRLRGGGRRLDRDRDAPDHGAPLRPR